MPSPVEGQPEGVLWDEYPEQNAPGFSFGDLVNFAGDQTGGLDNVTKLDAFEYMLRRCEHSVSTLDEDTYHTFYGGSRFNDFSDHPVSTGEKKGIPLPPSMCVAAGFPNGQCVSTAAGAYQLTRPTWEGLRVAGSWGARLNDFSPESQDEAARRLLIEIRALPLIEAGDIAGAIAKASTKWASLPGSKAGQGGRTLDFALNAFNDAATGLA